MTRPSEKSEVLKTARRMLDAGLSRGDGLDYIDQGLIIAALERSGGNICGAARILAVHRNTLERQIAELGLEDVPRIMRDRKKQMVLAFMLPRKNNRSIQIGEDARRFA